MRSQRLSLLLWAAGGAAWLLFAIVYADASKLGHERRPQAVARSNTVIHETVQVGLLFPRPADSSEPAVRILRSRCEDGHRGFSGLEHRVWILEWRV